MTVALPDPRERALGLLRTMLDPQQREDLLELGGFRVRTPGHVYWIPLAGPPSRAPVGAGRIESLCVGPDRPGRMPPEDVAITLLSWVRTDPVSASSTANVLGRRPVPAETPEDDLVRMMALQGRRRARVPLPAPAGPPRPVLSPRERRDLLARIDLVRARVSRRMGGRRFSEPAAG